MGNTFVARKFEFHVKVLQRASPLSRVSLHQGLRLSTGGPLGGSSPRTNFLYDFQSHSGRPSYGDLVCGCAIPDSSSFFDSSIAVPVSETGQNRRILIQKTTFLRKKCFLPKNIFLERLVLVKKPFFVAEYFSRSRIIFLRGFFPMKNIYSEK